MSKYRAEYKQFFESHAGIHMIDWMNTEIAKQHEHAENNPDKARDYVTRAKGIREVLMHINIKLGGKPKVS